jgi:hypothetical protein
LPASPAPMEGSLRRLPAPTCHLLASRKARTCVAHGSCASVAGPGGAWLDRLPHAVCNPTHAAHNLHVCVGSAGAHYATCPWPPARMSSCMCRIRCQDPALWGALPCLNVAPSAVAPCAGAHGSIRTTACRPWRCTERCSACAFHCAHSWAAMCRAGGAARHSAPGGGGGGSDLPGPRSHRAWSCKSKVVAHKVDVQRLPALARL